MAPPQTELNLFVITTVVNQDPLGAVPHIRSDTSLLETDPYPNNPYQNGVGPKHWL
jgi:hypothetical protein